MLRLLIPVCVVATLVLVAGGAIDNMHGPNTLTEDDLAERSRTGTNCITWE